MTRLLYHNRPVLFTSRENSDSSVPCGALRFALNKNGTFSFFPSRASCGIVVVFYSFVFVETNVTAVAVVVQTNQIVSLYTGDTGVFLSH